MLTHFLAINVVDGTTGTRTDTMSMLTSVSVTIAASEEFSAESSLIFAKVSAKVGFSVQVARATTRTESSTMTWSFNRPGYYGIYKGTRAVSGTVTSAACLSLFGGPDQWTRFHTQSYTTFASMEEGTITCEAQVPSGTVRELARRQLGC